MKEKISSVITEVNTILQGAGTIQTAMDLIVLLGLIVIFCGCILWFRANINKKTKAQIQRFKQDGKYLPAIYIELNTTMEQLRYFVFSRRWRKRIIRQYNLLFAGFEGRRLKEVLSENISCKLPIWSSFSDLVVAIDLLKTDLERIRNDRRSCYEKYGERIWAITNSTYNHTYAVGYLKELCALMEEQSVLLVGSAGNGKTSLMCRLSEIIMANKMPCLLVNARDIKEDCFDYIKNMLPLIPALKKHTKLYLRLISVILFLQRKHFYILIDAINENDREIFVQSIGNLNRQLSGYKRIRLLMSCRSEYFESRYKNMFSEGDVKPYIFNANDAEYDSRVTRKLINAYSKHYHVHGPFSPEMKEKLMNSLFLTRIFFEVNSNRDELALEFRNAEIYKLYFERIDAENPEINLKVLVNQIAQIMFERFTFDRISMECLHLSKEEANSLRKVLDNNLVISHTVQSGIGITEREEEFVYFVFDELRDFCLARYLLMSDEQNADSNYSLLFKNASLLFAKRLSPIEGIIKYAYHHFKIIGRHDLCEKLLNSFGESDIQYITDHHKRYHSRRRYFSNFGIELIFSEGNVMSPGEKLYVIKCIEKRCSNYWEIFWFLLRNEYGQAIPNMELALDIFMHWEEYEVPQKILYDFFEDRLHQYTRYHDEKLRVEILKEAVDKIRKERGELSKPLKMLLIILSAYDYTEFALEEYHDFILDEELYHCLQGKIVCPEVNQLINELKDYKTNSRNEGLDMIQYFIEYLKQEECDE